MPRVSTPTDSPALGATGLSLADEQSIVLKTMLNLAEIATALGHTFTARQRATLNFCLAVLGDDEDEAPGDDT